LTGADRLVTPWSDWHNEAAAAATAAEIGRPNRRLRSGNLLCPLRRMSHDELDDGELRGQAMVIEAGLITGYVIRWAVGKAKRVGGRLDDDVDLALDSGLDRLHTVVVAKLGGHPVLADLEEEAANAGQVSELTRQQVELAVQAAAGKDQAFAEAITALAQQLRTAEQAGAQATAIGQDATAVAGDVTMHGQSGAVVAWNVGTVQMGSPAPPAPDRAPVPPVHTGPPTPDPS
jgi:hypothetical protein